MDSLSAWQNLHMIQITRLSIALVLVGSLFCLQKGSAQAIRVTVDFKPVPQANGNGIDFAGKTNLPVGTVMIFSAGPKIGPRYRGLSLPSDEIPSGTGTLKTVVQKDGSFKGQVKTSGKLKTGNYLCKIDVPVFLTSVLKNSRGQPDQVYKIIGNRGENLAGPLVKKGSGIGIGSYCKIEVQVEVDFFGKENAKIKRREKRKYIQLLKQFKQGHEALIALREQGVLVNPHNQLGAQWYLRLKNTATSVEFLTSQEAIKQLRTISYELELMYLNTCSKRDPEFAQSKKKYEATIQDLEVFIDGIK